VSPAQPQRLVLSRNAGFDLQAMSLALNGLPARRVTRPGPWANPFSINAAMAQFGLKREAAQHKAVATCAAWLAGEPIDMPDPGPPPSRQAIRAALAGHNLACWCAPGTPCHADLLIGIANGAADD
jgi:hypothetical protein